MVMMLNPVAQGLTGWRKISPRGALTEVFASSTSLPGKRPAVVARPGRQGRDWPTIPFCWHGDGTERPIDDSGRRSRTISETLSAWSWCSGCTRKLSEQARERLVERRQNRTAAVRERRKDEFLAVISHELRSPLLRYGDGCIC
jgi:signal transduction histidine kinase